VPSAKITGRLLNSVNSQPENQPHRRTVLLVEDDIVIRSPLAEYLRVAGYVIVEAANAAEAIAVFAAGVPIDLVFSDVRMPGPMDGLGLARWIRREHPGVRIVLTSGADNQARADKIAEMFLPKPYQASEIAARIGRLFAEPAPPSRGSIAGTSRRRR
jgi:two-component system, response regulator PdtaR